MRTDKIIFKIAAFCFLAIFAQKAYAQPGSDLPSEQVEVIKIFEAQLAESEKVPLSPELPVVDTTIEKQTYDVPPKTVEVDYPAPRIRPITHKSGDEEIPDAFKAYLKLGGGLPASIYGEGAFNTVVKRGEKSAYDLGLNLLHHSGNFSNEDVENQRFGLTKAEAKGNYYFDKGYAAGGRLGYKSNRVSYYGYSTDDLEPNIRNLDKEDVKQVFSTFDLGAKFFNGVQTAGDLNYNTSLDFYTHSNSDAASETGIDLKGSATKWIAGKHSFDIGLRTDFTWYNDTLEDSQTLHNFTIHPAFTFHGSRIKAKIGGKLVSSNDEFTPFPDLEFVVNLTGNELALYVGLEGGLQKNTFRSLSEYCPYLHNYLPDSTLRNTKYYHGYAGLRGNLKFFEYTIQAGFKPTDGLALFRFLNDSDPPSYHFEVVYDDVDIINFTGSIKAEPLKGLEIIGTVSQNIYNTSPEQDKAWHLPTLELNGQVIYTTKDNKLRAKAQLFLESIAPSNLRRAPGLSVQVDNDHPNSLFDISFGAEYWVAKNFGVFLDLNNLLDNKWERWRYYPTYGINVLGGISARF